MWAYDRPTRIVEGWEDVARLHFSFSGTLLKQLEDPAVRETFADAVDIGGLLDRYRRGPFEFSAAGSITRFIRLTPEADWDAQTGWWLGLGRHRSAATGSRVSGRRRWDSAWR